MVSASDLGPEGREFGPWPVHLRGHIMVLSDLFICPRVERLSRGWPHVYAFRTYFFRCFCCQNRPRHASHACFRSKNAVRDKKIFDPFAFHELI